MKKKDIVIFILLIVPSPLIAQINTNTIVKEIIFFDDFESETKNWIVEFEKPSTSHLRIDNGKLDINTSAGATVWFRNKLSGDILITFDATIIDSSGINDRVSDLNAFWMASDQSNNNIFTRNGKFSSYDNLNLYYAGIGGHDNTKTRFRKYHYNGEKPVIKEYLDKDHLLEGNKTYSIEIFVEENRTMFYLNKILYFDYLDDNPITEGYFAFRTTRSHQQIKNFKIYHLLKEKKCNE